MDNIDWLQETIPKFFTYYKNRLSELKEKLGKRRPDGEYLIFKYPCYPRNEINWMFEYLEKKGFDVSDLRNQLSGIDNDFISIRQEKIDLYIDHLLYIFRHLIGDTSYIDDITSDPSFFEIFLLDRDYIEAIRLELESLIDISQDLEKLTQLDAKVQSIIPKMIATGTYGPFDHFYAPPDIWWRHLEDKYGKRERCPKKI
jgi:hypothetical protein